MLLRLTSIPQLAPAQDEASNADVERVSARARSLLHAMLASADALVLHLQGSHDGRVEVLYELSGPICDVPRDALFPLEAMYVEPPGMDVAITLGRTVRHVVLSHELNAAQPLAQAVRWLRPGAVGVGVPYRAAIGVPLVRGDADGRWRSTCAAVAATGGWVSIGVRRSGLDVTTNALARQVLRLLDDNIGTALGTSAVDPRLTLRELVSLGDAWCVDARIGAVGTAAIRAALAHDIGDFLTPGNLASAQVPPDHHHASQLTTKGEIVELLTPPWTSDAPIAGLRHHLTAFFPTLAPSLPDPAVPCVRLGSSVDESGIAYGAGIPLQSLPQHMVVFGATGSGKTNTVLGVLDSLPESVPFLVIDPIKRDYSAHFRARVGAEVTVYDLTPENTPRFNPFIPPPGVSVAEHAGVLAMALVLPFTTTHVAFEYMRQLIIDDYIGWSAWNARAAGLAQPIPLSGLFRQHLLEAAVRPPTFPGFLVDAPKLLARLARHGAQSDWMKEALEFFRRRFDLMAHSKMADIFSPTDPRTTIDPLLERRTVLELGRILDSTEADAVAGMIVALLTTQRRASETSGGQLRHVLVLEEAHRLMPMASDAGSHRELRQGAGEQLSTLLAQNLAESRAWGQAMILVEQRPSRLRTDAIANAATIVVHRLGEQDDQASAVKAIGLRERHDLMLGVLRIGEAMVRLPGAPFPSRVRIPLVEGNES